MGPNWGHTGLATRVGTRQQQQINITHPQLEAEAGLEQLNNDMSTSVENIESLLKVTVAICPLLTIHVLYHNEMKGLIQNDYHDKQ